MNNTNYLKKELSQKHNKQKIVNFSAKILSWFYANGRSFPWRKKSISLYQLIVTEILLQRTRAETVASFSPLFFSKYPNWKTLSATRKRTLENILKPIGLWSRRAVTLSSLAKEMSKKNGRFPRRREDIEKLPGMGQYVTNAVLLFRDNAPEPLLDSNMARVLERYFGPRKLADIRYDPYLQDLAYAVVNCEDPPRINWAILDFAAIVCKVKGQRCDECPLRHSCQHCCKSYDNS